MVTNSGGKVVKSYKFIRFDNFVFRKTIRKIWINRNIEMSFSGRVMLLVTKKFVQNDDDNWVFLFHHGTGFDFNIDKGINIFMKNKEDNYFLTPKENVNWFFLCLIFQRNIMKRLLLIFCLSQFFYLTAASIRFAKQTCTNSALCNINHYKFFPLTTHPKHFSLILNIKLILWKRQY